MSTCGCIYDAAQLKRVNTEIARIDSTDWDNHPSPFTANWLRTITHKRRVRLVARRTQITAEHAAKHQPRDLAALTLF